MGIADGRNTPADGGGPDLTLGFMGEEGGHGRRRGRQRALCGARYTRPGKSRSQYGRPAAWPQPSQRARIPQRPYLPGGEWQGLTSGQPSGNVGLPVAKVGCLGVDFG
jgi:hypothetical protein